MTAPVTGGGPVRRSSVRYMGASSGHDLRLQDISQAVWQREPGMCACDSERLAVPLATVGMC